MTCPGGVKISGRACPAGGPLDKIRPYDDARVYGTPRLDDMLGGGLLPGTLTVIYGATGIGKTHLGLRFAATGASADGARGILFDMNVRGDSQQHHAYAERLLRLALRRWTHTVMPMAEPYPPAEQMRRLLLRRASLGGQAARLPGAARRTGSSSTGTGRPPYNHALYTVRPFVYFHLGAGSPAHRGGRHRADGRAGGLHPALHLRRAVPEDHPPRRETLGMEICLPVWKHREFIDGTATITRR